MGPYSTTYGCSSNGPQNGRRYLSPQKSWFQLCLRCLQWGSSKICAHCDNMAVVYAVNKKSAHDPAISSLLRLLCLLCAIYPCGSPSPGHKEHGSRCPIQEQVTAISIIAPTGLPHSNDNPQLTAGPALQSPHQRQLSDLDITVEQYLAGGITLSTRAAYTSALRRYLNFCHKFGLEHPFPLSEAQLCRFAAFLGQERLKHRTIKSYLSGLRFAQIHQGLGNPFTADMPRLEYLLAGLKREEAHTGARPKPRLPITAEVLKRMKQVWLSPPVKVDDRMLWAAACTGFFGFLRAGEFTVPSKQAYDPEVHLNLADMAIDSHEHPSLIRLLIKQSKTDTFREGVEVFLGASKGEICLVRALVDYLSVRPATPGPLFVFESGSPLTRASLVASLHEALQQVGLNHREYNGHSFRIGTATTAAQRGLEESRIQTLGRWKSEAYKTYIKLPRSQLAVVSQTLAT